MMGFEPMAPRTTIWCSNQLSYIHRVIIYFAVQNYNFMFIQAMKELAFSELLSSVNLFN